MTEETEEIQEFKEFFYSVKSIETRPAEPAEDTIQILLDDQDREDWREIRRGRTIAGHMVIGEPNSGAGTHRVHVEYETKTGTRYIGEIDVPGAGDPNLDSIQDFCRDCDASEFEDSDPSDNPVAWAKAAKLWAAFEAA